MHVIHVNAYPTIYKDILELEVAKFMYAYHNDKLQTILMISSIVCKISINMVLDQLPNKNLYLPRMEILHDAYSSPNYIEVKI